MSPCIRGIRDSNLEVTITIQLLGSKPSSMSLFCFYKYAQYIIHLKLKQIFNSNSSGRFYKHGLTLIPEWISNHVLSKVWGEITYPLLNFNGCTVEV